MTITRVLIAFVVIWTAAVIYLYSIASKADSYSPYQYDEPHYNEPHLDMTDLDCDELAPDLLSTQTRDVGLLTDCHLRRFFETSNDLMDCSYGLEMQLQYLSGLLKIARKSGIALPAESVMPFVDKRIGWAVGCFGQFDHRFAH